MKKLLFIICSFILLCSESRLAAQEYYEQDEEMISVIQALKLNPDNCPSELAAQKSLPFKKGHTAFVILEIAEMEDYETSYNCYVLIREDVTGKIQSLYRKENAYISDAVALQSVIIDTAPYKIRDGKRAFGIRVQAANNSRIAQFSETTLSLFEPESNVLVCVLDELPVSVYHGEWDGFCEGQFTNTETILMISDVKTNGYYDMIAKSTIKTTTNYLGDEECEYEEDISYQTYTIRFADEKYKWE